MGFRTLRPMNGYLVRGLNRDVMRICNESQRNINIHRSWFSSVTVKTNATCREKLVADVVENVGLKLQFSCWFSIHLLLHQLYTFYYETNSIYIHASLLNLISCIDLYLIEKVYPAKFFSSKWVEFQSNVFDDVRNKLVYLHCDVVTDENMFGGEE